MTVKPGAQKNLITVVALSLLVLILLTQPALADKTDPDLIPPDVTLITNPTATTTTSGATSGAATPTTATPGLTNPAAAANSVVPVGTAGPAAPASMSNLPIPNSSRVTAAIQQPPGTPITGAKPPPSAGAPPSTGSQANYQGSGAPLDPNKPDPVATIVTSKGEIQIRLFRQLAPKTVDNFIDLCTRGFYNGLTFHRVEPGFVIQGGDPNGNGTGVFVDPKSGQTRWLPLEVTPKLSHNQAGVVAMARMATETSASCQFYITLAPAPSLNLRYAIFGGVITGMPVVNSIQKGDKIISASVREQ